MWYLDKMIKELKTLKDLEEYMCILLNKGIIKIGEIEEFNKTKFKVGLSMGLSIKEIEKVGNLK